MEKITLPRKGLNVRQMMNASFRLLRPDDSLKTVVEYFQEHKINILPVVDESEKLIAVFPKTRLYRALLEGAAIDSPCEKYMVTDPIYIYEDQEYDVSSLVRRVTNSPVANVVVLNRAGRVVGTIGIAEYLRESLNMIMSSSATLESMFRVNHEGIIITDRRGGILRINPAAERMFRVSFEQLHGKSLRDCLPEIADSLEPNIVARRIVKGLPVLANNIPIIENGERIGSNYAFLDISEAERMADELEIVKKMQTTIEAVINSSNDGVFVSDTNGMVRYVNDKARILLNERIEDIIGNPLQKLLNTKGPVKSSAAGTPVVDALDIGGKQCIVTHTPYRSRTAGGSSGIVSTIFLNDSAYAEELARRWFEMNRKMGYYRRALEQTVDRGSKFDQIVTTNPEFVKIKRDAQRIARSSSTVLLTGESGVGKSLFARGIHEESPRAKHPFIVCNCVSIPESLFESELFGYAPGSFTGALKSGKPGYFERADKGTIFLDEVGDIPLSIQAKLLQVLQDKEFERVGGTRKQSVDVRIIAATNRDLREAIARKEFREDLYYRLNVIAFHLPALRERRQDIVPLAATFITKYNRLIGSRITGIKDSARKVLREYDWPGNIRELENAIEHAANYVWEGEIGVENLPDHIAGGVSLRPAFDRKQRAATGSQAAGEVSFEEAKTEFERAQLLDALKQTNGNKSAAAKLMNLSRSAFYDRLAKYEIK